MGRWGRWGCAGHRVPRPLRLVRVWAWCPVPNIGTHTHGTTATNTQAAPHLSQALLLEP